MGKAYECDRCEEVEAGRPYQSIAWGPYRENARVRVRHKEKARDVCESCWNEFMRFMDDPDATAVPSDE